jgi:DNA-binding protein HU-beta
MNSNDLAECLATEFDLSKVSARVVLDRVFATIVTSLCNDEEISISGFGKFKIKALAPREGRNPATGAKIQIGASRHLTFSAVKAVKLRIKE